MKFIFIVLSFVLSTSLFANEKSLIDKKSHLEWQDNAEHNELKYKLARGYCKQLGLNSFHDWRLPTKKEMLQLVQNKKLKAKLHYLEDALYWTSTEDENDPLLNAYTVYSGNAHASLSDKCDDYYVVCVRDIIK